MAYAEDFNASQDVNDTAVPETGNGKVIDTLLKAIQADNLVDELDEQELSKIATQAILEYGIDKTSRTDWEEEIKQSTDLAMLAMEEKNYPYKGSSNVKYPLITTAALQFNARAYPAVVQNDQVVKCRVNGRDPQGTKAQRADRVSEHASWQLITEDPDWENDTDKMLVILPIVGCVFRKVFFDPALGRKCSKMVFAEKLVVNYWAKSLETAPRYTEEMDLYPYQIQERILDGRFIEFEYQNATGKEGEDKGEGEDESAPHLFLEQHRLIDLDGDGYPEPYIVTIHKQTEKICRIVANFSEDTITADLDGNISSIRKLDHYTKYDFLPSPDGGFYGWGFGTLLRSINESINSTLNQMLDAGHLANMQGGLISSVLGLREKKFRLGMGEWKVVNASGPINQAVMPITYPGPSAVLFSLLGLLVDAGKDVAAIKDVLTGEQKNTMTATATIALIEQGLQVFTAIFKRTHRALRRELAIHSRINAETVSVEEYSQFFDELDKQGQPVQFDPREDYQSRDMDISPVSDPNSVTKMQQITKAQLVFEMSQNNPMIDPVEATKRFLEAAQIEDIEGLMVEGPDPQQQAVEQMITELGIEKEVTEIMAIKAKAIKDIADAEAKEEGTQISIYQAMIEALKQGQEQNGQGRISGMEGQPDNPGGNQIAFQNDGEIPAGLQGPAVQPVDALGLERNAG